MQPTALLKFSRIRLRMNSLRMYRSPSEVKSFGGLLDGAVRIGLRIMAGGVRPAPACKRVRKPVEIEIDHRCREQRQRLADDQAADHGVTERLADFRSGPGAEHQRHAAEQ